MVCKFCREKQINNIILVVTANDYVVSGKENYDIKKTNLQQDKFMPEFSPRVDRYKT